MGLLDGFFGQGWDDPKSQAVMQLAGGLLGGDFAGGVKGYGDVMSSAKDKAAARRMKDLQEQEQQMRMQAAKQQMAEQAQMKALTQQFSRPGTPGLAPLQGDSAAGILPSSGKEAVAPSFDYNGFAGALAGIDPMRALELQKSLAKQGPEFSTEPRYDQNGRAFILAKDGSMKYLDGVAARDKLEEVRLGDKVAFRSPYSTEIQGSMPIGQSPDSKASNALGWANFGLSSKREAREAANANSPSMVWNADLGTFVNPKTLQTGMPNGPDGKPMQSQKPLNDVQSKALLFGTRMAEADKVLGGLSKKEVDQPGYIKRTAEAVPMIGNGLGVLANATQSDGQQQVEQAQRDFINAVLRRESGAAIAPSEFDSAKKQYFPQPFDSETVKKQKAKNRTLATQGILAEVPNQGRSMMLRSKDTDPSDPLGIRGGN